MKRGAGDGGHLTLKLLGLGSPVAEVGAFLARDRADTVTGHMVWSPLVLGPVVAEYTGAHEALPTSVRAETKPQVAPTDRTGLEEVDCANHC